MPDEFVLAKLQGLKDRIARGEEVYLYEKLYIPVDSVINDDTPIEEVTIGLLRRLGLLGWSVVATIPRTVGIGLANRRVDIGTDVWGAGIGGNVIGAYLILRLTATPSLPDDVLADYISRNVEDFTDEDGQ